MMILHGDAKVMAAFVKARGEIGATVGKDAKGNYGRYATLAALTEATTAPLAKHGCAIVQEASFNDDGVLVETWLIHESGGMLQFTPLPMPVKDRTAQSVGSAITYARRYALAAVCGIAPDDDDAEAATSGKPAPRPQAQQQPKPAPATTQATPAQAAQGDPLFDEKTAHPPATGTNPQRVNQVRLNRLHAVGTEAYGDAWDEKRPLLVEKVSKGSVTSSRDLTPKEAEDLIAGIERKLAETPAQTRATA